MRVLTFFGTRPEIIRLSPTIQLLDQYCDHQLVHSGQNYDPLLSDVFFEELGIREPNSHLGVRAENFHQQVSQILALGGETLCEYRPDRILILGDTNSALISIIASRMGIPVFHMEAGNRCFDDRVPEEINRRIVDHTSTILMPYTKRSKENLIREGIERHRIFVIGNPIREVLERNEERIGASPVLENVSVEGGRYFLVTLHRAENVDDPKRLMQFLHGLELVHSDFGDPVVVSVHPRTAARLRQSNMSTRFSGIRLCEPFGFFDFVRLERNARCVLTDSGTVQEECAILRVPNVTLRDVTERPETIEVGSNILTGSAPERIRDAVRLAIETPNNWLSPEGYDVPNVSAVVARIMLGYHHGLALTESQELSVAQSTDRPTSAE